jgi:hypothetical protein
VVGRTLTARVGGVSPTSATPAFRWYRDSQPIRGARAATYVVQAADLGHRLHVVVSMRAQNWLPRDRRSVAVTDVLTRPHVAVRRSVRHGRVHLRLVVSSPGLATPSSGHARIWLGQRLVGRVNVADGRGGRLLAPMRHGTHTLTIVYRGGSEETVGRRSVTVRVP